MRIERVFEPSPTLPGRTKTHPVHIVRSINWRYRFSRKADAVRFVQQMGGECYGHEAVDGAYCRHCHASRTPHESGPHKGEGDGR